MDEVMLGGRKMKHTKAQVKRKIEEFKRLYAAGILPLDKVKKLEAIPGWTWEIEIRQTKHDVDEAPPLHCRSQG